MTSKEMEKKLIDQQKRKQPLSENIERVLMNVMGLSASIGDGLEQAEALGITAGDVWSNPYLIVKQVLFYLLGIKPQKKQQILDFFTKYNYINEMSMEEILEFTTDTVTKGSVTKIIPFENGENCIDEMIADIRSLIK